MGIPQRRICQESPKFEASIQKRVLEQTLIRNTGILSVEILFGTLRQLLLELAIVAEIHCLRFYMKYNYNSDLRCSQSEAIYLQLEFIVVRIRGGSGQNRAKVHSDVSF